MVWKKKKRRKPKRERLETFDYFKYRQLVHGEILEMNTHKSMKNAKYKLKMII